MAHVAVALALASGIAAQAEDVAKAREILESAAAAAELVFSASYEGRLEIRSGSSERVVTGDVKFVKFPYSDLIGGKLVIDGQIRQPNQPDGERFQAAYNGEIVRRYLAGAGVILEAEPAYGGQELLRGGFGALVLRHLLAVEPYMVERSTPAVKYLGPRTVDGVRCDLVEVGLDTAGTTVRWYLGAEDHLPRKREREFRSARGNLVSSVMTLRNLTVNTEIGDEAFAINAPEGVKVEMMGKRPPPPLKVGDMAPEWTLTDGDGVEHSLADYRGKLVVLDFWASWCPHCRKAMPSMQRLHDRYASRGVEIFGINCRERGRVDAAAFVREQGYSYPVLVNGNAIAPVYKVQGIPAFYVISPEGRILHKSSGFNQQKELLLVDLIEQYLADEGA